MKYCIKDQLSPFEFHDAELSLLSFDGNTLRLSVRFLNVHKGIPENPYDADMDILTHDSAITIRRSCCMMTRCMTG